MHAYWVRAFVRGCVGGWIGTCDHACVGARASERDMRSTSSNLKASRREARWATSCLPPHVAESARLSFRMHAWRVAAVVPMCVGVSVVSEVKLPASSSDRNERQCKYMMYTGTANPVAYCILVRFRFNQLAEWIHLAPVGNWRFFFARSH